MLKAALLILLGIVVGVVVCVVALNISWWKYGGDV
jgi:hypothetical protein